MRSGLCRLLVLVAVASSVLVACDSALLSSLLGSTLAAGTPPGGIVVVSEFRFDGSEADARGVASYLGDPGLLQYAEDRRGNADSALVLQKLPGGEDESRFSYVFGSAAAGSVRTVAFWTGCVVSADCAGGVRVAVAEETLTEPSLFGESWYRSDLWEGDWLLAQVTRGEFWRFRFDVSTAVPDLSGPSTASPGDGSWHHLVFVFDAARVLRIYLDGELRKSSDVTAPRPLAIESPALVIGADNGEPLLDDLLLLETPLGPDDVAALYAGELPLP